MNGQIKIFQHHFNKIQFVNGMADQIGAYGVQLGLADLFDNMDMNCGAVPAGDFASVIDPDSPVQFLTLYTQIAENRLAFAVCSVLQLNASLLAAMKDFAFRLGQANQVEGIISCMDALEVYDAFVMDGMPGENKKTFSEHEENCVCWKNSISIHKESWQRWGGSVSIFCEILKSFVEGLLQKTNIQFSVEEGGICRLSANVR